MDIERLKGRLKTLKEITKASDRTGWMIDEVAFFNYALVKLYKPELVVQIGHLWGKSATFLLEALTDSFLMNGKRVEEAPLSGDKKFFDYVQMHWPKPVQGKLISIDAFPYGNWREGIEYLTKEYGKENFDYKVLKSDEFFKQFGPEIKKAYAGRTILGIVDGDHTREGAMKDLEGMVDIGAAHIILDDTRWLPHIKGVCDEFVAKHKDYSQQEFIPYNGFAIINKKE